MKTFITSLSLAAALGLSMASTTASAASMDMAHGWAACNTEYAACLRDGSNMSPAMDPKAAMDQGTSNAANWASCNHALAACYKSLK